MARSRHAVRPAFFTTSLERGPAGAESKGFTLLEVLVATTMLVAIAIGVAHLILVGVRAGWAARTHTSAAVLAASKIEQLRSLVWAYEPGAGSAVPRSDFSADVSVDPPSDGGPGLAASPPGTLAANVPPYVDYLDGQGRWVGTGAAPPGGAVYVRRWAVAPLPADGARTLVLSVFVTTVARDHARPATWPAAAEDEVLLVLLRTRVGQ